MFTIVATIKEVLWSKSVTRLFVVDVKVGTAFFCIATPCVLVIVIDVSEEPNEMMTVLSGFPCPH
jgi:hypothetical protein